MDRLVIQGHRRLSGTVAVSGSKNAALPILAATILCDGECSLGQVPDLEDIRHLIEILGMLGVEVKRTPENRVTCRVVDETKSTAPYEMVNKLRGSIAALGPLLARRGEATIAMPGGCSIGDRPVDLHIKGLQALGAEITVEHGLIVAKARRLRGRHIYLGGSMGSSVLATANVMMAAALADGVSIIEHAAEEPEIEDLADFLNKCGASIEGAGTHQLKIKGVRRLYGAAHDVIADRIEAGTLMCAAAITQGDVTLTGAVPRHMDAVLDKLREIGVVLRVCGDRIRVTMDRRPGETEITTLAYPGIPTDMQAQLMALLCVGDGASVITERVYPDRFMHVAELVRMGARIRKIQSTAVIAGRAALSGAPVKATDLRASAALVIAGLAAEGETTVHDIIHMDRGYEKLEDKLTALGAEIRRVKDEKKGVAAA